MDFRPTRRSAPMTARLLALVVVPLVAVTVLSTQRIDAEQRDAGEATALVDVVELQQAVAAILPPAQLEWIALSGFAGIDELGLPRDLVVGLSGFDLESIYEENLVDLEAALDDLGDRYGSLVLTDGQLLGDRLAFIRGGLETQRRLSDEGRATGADIDRVFEELDELLTQLLAASRPIAGPDTVLDRHRARLAALGNVLLSAGEIARVNTSGLFRGAIDPVAIARADAIHETNVAAFTALLNPVERRDFERVQRAGGEQEFTADLDAAPTVLARDAGLVAGAADFVFAQLAGFAALQDYSDSFHEHTAALVRERAEQARSEARNTQILLWTIASFTLALTVLVLWSILAPLRRLTRRAAAISNGELGQPPLRICGPGDIRALTGTVNDMATTLGRVDEQITLLATGELDEVSATQPLPGAIGVSLRRSVEHLGRVTAQLQRSEALASAIIAQADDAIWTVDEHGEIRTANDASARLTGTPCDDQIGRPIGDLLSQTTGEATVLTRAGHPPKVLVARSVIDVGDERITAVIAHDISERSRFEDRLHYQALHDALTGLPNRFAVLEHLDELTTTHDGNIAVLYVDLDGFKSVNDMHGHGVGDLVLADVADRLRRVVRNGEFVGRLGGDEFVVVTHRFAQLADVMSVGHRLVREIEVPMEHDGRVFSLSASVGVAVPPAGTSSLDMLGQADNAVFQAKRKGRGRVGLFDTDVQDDLDRILEIELALRDAVGRDELVLHLQPVIDLRTGRFCGAEALLRWLRPGHGMVPPNEFIPIAERSTIIVDIERWVLMRACERLVEWRRRDPGCDRRIAVNISGRHLVEGDLLADVTAVLDLTGADPSMLELELTESQLLEDTALTTEVLQGLRDLGITIAVDDFGTGYSSMTYLRELPVDVVKIDRSFVSGATEHGFDSTVIESILAMGRTLQLGVVAEGIETSDQLEFLRQRGCGSAQGYLFARPMPIEEAEDVIFGAPPSSTGRVMGSSQADSADALLPLES